ncbi:hypothetical protein BGZ83_000947 [Gryganskiella cystojenkinii]|nr:hypothetical protein BGZ83_000947 [Gryganskiella cystojenkinii]
MSISPPLSSGSMAPTSFSSLKDPNTLKSESDTLSPHHGSSVTTALDAAASSPPVTPPTKSSGPDAGSSAMHSTTLPSPPPSSSSRSKNHQHEAGEEDSRSIEKIARSLSSPSREEGTNGSKTHSSSSSTSSLHHNSNNHVSPSSSSSAHSQHAAVAKTKTLGHLARSTSSEVDNEVAHALASGRSVVSKTDWKEDDAQYLVNLIEAQFPKGNIIWEWVGQQMVSRGFSKSQCRSKWKRIRTKVLHGDGSQSAKDRDYRENSNKFHEPDELADDDEDELAPAPTDNSSSRYHSRQESGRSYGSAASSTVRGQPSSHHRQQQHQQHDEEEEENEIWSDDEDPSNNIAHQNGYGRNSNNQYQNYDETHHNSSPSGRQRQHSSSQHYRQASSNIGPDEHAGEDSRLSAIAATPNSFGKIEWKPEDSDFLVRLIETKFASRKVDWAWVSKQMEGRGYDRTQCKSRWWRVQHRQNHGGSHHHGSNGLGGGARGGAAAAAAAAAAHRQRQESGGTITNRQDEKESFFDSDNEDTTTTPQREYASESQQHQGRENISLGSRASSVSEDPLSKSRQEHEGNVLHINSKNRDDQPSSTEVRKASGTGSEHQKHIEWKEEDSRYMYKLIEREFPVGNVVWNVIAEKMASRGYSQTQCMSKWRRHLKHTKLSGEGNKAGGGGMSMDLDTADMASVTSGGRGASATVAPDEYRQVRVEGGNKRIKTGGLRDSISGSSRLSEDYGMANAHLDARLVEMEYDRYYDAGGKRRRIDDGESESHYSSQRDHSGHHRHSGHHHARHSHHHGSHHHSTHAHEHRSTYDHSPYDDRYDSQSLAPPDGHRYKDHREAQYYADYYRDERDTLTVPPSSSNQHHHRQHARERSHDNNDYQYESRAPHPAEEIIDREDASGRYEEQIPGEAVTIQEMDEEREEQQQQADESRREPPFSDSVPILTSGGEPQSSWTEEQEREESHPHPTNDKGMAYASPLVDHPQQHQGRQRSSSVASGYREVYNGSYYDASAPSASQRGGSRAVGVEDRERSHRPAEPASRPRPIARSPERGFVGTSSREQRILVPYDDYPPEVRRREAYPQRNEQRPSSSSRYYPHDEFEYDRRTRIAARYEDDFADPMIDYALEDDLDWAAGRWESRDMARLAAAVARQGRRWDAIRERIRVPVLVSPYDDDEDVYDGVRFEPVVPYYRASDSNRRTGQSQQQASYQQQSRVRSNSHGHHHGHNSQSRGHRQSYQQQQAYPPRQSSSAVIHQSQLRSSQGREYIPRMLKAHPSTSSSKRAALPRTIPEVVDVDLTADGPSGDEQQQRQQQVVVVEDEVDRRVDVSMQVDQESLSELASVAIEHQQKAQQEQELAQAQALSRASVQDENPEVEMEEAQQQDDKVQVNEVPEQMEEDEKVERVSEEKDRSNVHQDGVVEDKEEEEEQEGGDMSVEGVVIDDAAVTATET